MRPNFIILAAFTTILGCLFWIDPALAQTTTTQPLKFDKTAAAPENISYILNTMLFVFGGMFVVFMAAGFCMLEAGIVHKDSVATISIKNISAYAISTVCFFFLGYNLMYPGDDWIIPELIGKLQPLSLPDPSSDTGSSYATGSDIFFQSVFVATAASIVSGALAERVKINAYLVFCVILGGFIYPIAGSWEWGSGWLDDIGFSDFAGGIIVHGVGGGAALAASLVIGPRIGRFSGTRIGRTSANSMALSTLGIFLLWIGFFGFNGGSQLGIGSLQDSSSISRIIVNTNLGGSGGLIGGLMLSYLVYGRVDVGTVLNCALGGLVISTAEPLAPGPQATFMFGILASLIVFAGKFLLEAVRIDDVVGAIPVHLGCGVAGVLLVPLSNSDANLTVQCIGVASIVGFSFFASLISWLLLAATMGVRTTAEEEQNGLDHTQVRTIV